jgi:integrase/recombinase XerD
MDDFADWLVRQGYARYQSRHILSVSYKIGRYLRRKGIHRIEDISSLTLHSYWRTKRQRAPWQAGSVRILEQFLRIRGILKYCPIATPATCQLAEYSEYLRDVRGLSPGTIEEQLRTVASFLVHIGFDDAPERLGDISSADIEGFVRKIGKLLSRETLKHRVMYVRSFLRFLAVSDKVPSSLADQIDTPRVYKQEKLPRSLSWKIVQAFLRSIPKTTVVGRRDYTMFFLMATYGLRVSEVVALTLDDVQWRAGLIRVRQNKTGNVLDLPLTDEAANVLIDYLRQVPRLTGYRNLFLRMIAPSGGVTPATVKSAFRLRSRQSGLAIPLRGSHSIRHSYAVHLLRQGTSLKTIGDLLGHRSTESTATYIRLATEELRDVGLPVPRPLRKKGGRS